MRTLMALCAATVVLMAAVAESAHAGGNYFAVRPWRGGQAAQPSTRARDFWSGYYGSRTFSYGGTYARPGYAPGPEPRVRISR